MDAVKIHNKTGDSQILLVCEHASNLIPEDLQNLGIDQTVQQAHVAWDIGAYGVAKNLADLLNATLIHPNFSRLVYDCNRAPDSPTAIPAKSEIYDIPGNQNLSDDARQARVARFYTPYWACLTDLVTDRVQAGLSPVIVTIHSFTPIYHGQKRATEIGVIHDQDQRYVDRLLACSAAQEDFKFTRNQPYGPSDDVTHTLVHQAMVHNLENAMIEIRNDLIDTELKQKNMAAFLAPYFKKALD